MVCDDWQLFTNIANKKTSIGAGGAYAIASPD